MKKEYVGEFIDQLINQFPSYKIRNQENLKVKKMSFQRCSKEQIVLTFSIPYKAGEMTGEFDRLVKNFIDENKNSISVIYVYPPHY